MTPLGNYFIAKIDPALAAQKSKEAAEGVVFFKRAMLWLFYLTIAANVVRIINPPTKPVESTITINSCPKAELELSRALDARDAITSSEAMTSVGRAKWESLRDRGIKAKEIRDALC